MNDSVDNYINKRQYRYVRVLAKAIPAIMAALIPLDAILVFLGIDLYIISAIGGASLLVILFMYLSSIALNPNRYNKICIYYIFSIFILSTTDYYIGIPLSNKGLFCLYMVFTAIALFTIIIGVKELKLKTICNSIDHSRKELYKYEVLAIKIIPIIAAGISFARTVFSYFNIDLPILSFIGGVPLLSIIFMYLTSIVFRFCVYHRIFIHYIAIIWILNVIDLHTELFVKMDARIMMMFFVTITGLTIFIALFYKIKK